MKNQDDNFYNKVKNLGEYEILNKILKSFPDHQIITINSLDFYKMNDGEKIQHLKNLCILN